MIPPTKPDAIGDSEKSKIRSKREEDDVKAETIQIKIQDQGNNELHAKNNLVVEDDADANNIDSKTGNKKLMLHEGKKTGKNNDDLEESGEGDDSTTQEENVSSNEQSTDKGYKKSTEEEDANSNEQSTNTIYKRLTEQEKYVGSSDESTGKHDEEQANNVNKADSVDISLHSRAHLESTSSEEEFPPCQSDILMHNKFGQTRVKSKKEILTIDKTYKNFKRSRRAWTAQEIALLKEGFAEFGSNWSAIKAKHGFLERTNIDLKDKWRNINKSSSYYTLQRREFGLLKKNSISELDERVHAVLERVPYSAAERFMKKLDFQIGTVFKIIAINVPKQVYEYIVKADPEVGRKLFARKIYTKRRSLS